ncbi:MAG: pyridoxamine 5'-phosphate oxidase [Pontimonas sp.]|nr:pyridoxamine 5'-phosphate oxidase [Pontimonas sp.]
MTSDPLSQRRDYGSLSLEEGSLLPDPLEQLSLWVKEADQADIYEPNAMVLSTIDPDGEPSSRTVLLRGIDDKGLYFYTDYGSRKGLALLANPSVSAVFPWYRQHRQVLIYGHATPTDPDISDAYFQTRPRGSQIGAWSSEQSRPIESRAALEAKVQEMEARFEGEDAIPRPESWGGFLIEPQRIEFWAGRTSRLHDRISFAREAQGWSTTRLQP